MTDLHRDAVVVPVLRLRRLLSLDHFRRRRCRPRLRGPPHRCPPRPCVHLQHAPSPPSSAALAASVSPFPSQLRVHASVSLLARPSSSVSSAANESIFPHPQAGIHKADHGRCYPNSPHPPLCQSHRRIARRYLSQPNVSSCTRSSAGSVQYRFSSFGPTRTC